MSALPGVESLVGECYRIRLRPAGMGKPSLQVTELNVKTHKGAAQGHRQVALRVLQVAISGTRVMTTAYASALEVQITATQRIARTYYCAGETRVS